MMHERGLEMDHSTVFRWVQRYAPEINQRTRQHLKMSGMSYRGNAFSLLTEKELSVRPCARENNFRNTTADILFRLFRMCRPRHAIKGNILSLCSTVNHTTQARVSS